MDTNWKQIIYFLQKIGDIQFQEDVWFGGKYYDWACDYGEAVNLLDDYWYYDAIEGNELNLPSPQLEYILKFNESLINYDKSANVSINMLSDPSWLRIVNDSNEVVKIIESALNDKV